MDRKRVFLLIAVVVALAAIVFGVIAASGGSSSDPNDGTDAMSTPSLGPSASSSLSASPGEGDPGTTGSGTSTNGSDEPVLTVFRNMYGQVGEAGVAPSKVPFVAGGEVHLVPGATVECVMEIAGAARPMEVTIPDQGGEDGFVPFGAAGVIDAPLGEHSWTVACTSSDGADWGDSGTVMVVMPELPPDLPPDLPSL